MASKKSNRPASDTAPTPVVASEGAELSSTLKSDPLGCDAFRPGLQKQRPGDPNEYELMRAFLANRPFESLVQAKRSRPRVRKIATVVDPGPRQVATHAAPAGAFIPAPAGCPAELSIAKNPVPNSSFGFVGTPVMLSAQQPVDGLIALPFETEKLEDIARNSLRICHYDERTGRFRPVRGSEPSDFGDYVFGRVAAPGIYTLVGLRTHPLVLQSIRLAGALGPLGPIVGDLPELRERLCLVILCADFMLDRLDRFEVMRDLVMANARAGLAFPIERMPMPVPVPSNHPGGLGSDLCDFCFGRSGLDLPEVDIIDEFPPTGRPTPGCAEGPWETAGPVNLAGCVKFVAVDPSDSRTIYCAAAHGGVWRLDDVGLYPYLSWRPLTDQQPLLKTVAIAIAPSDRDVLYYGEATGRIYRSNDRGGNWALTSPVLHHLSPTLFQPLRILVHPSTPEVVIVSGTAGLRVSVDGGATWLVRTTSPVEAVAMDPQDSSILYIAVRNEGVYKSFAMGADAASWSLVLPWSAATTPVNNSIRLALGFRNAEGTLQSDADRTVVAKLGNEVFVNHRGGRPDGDGWVSKGQQGGNGYGDWCNVVAVDPFDPNVILAGQMELFRTSDGGDGWSRVASYYRPHEDQQWVEFDRNRRNVVYIANDGGVFRSTDGGVTFFVEGDTVADAIGAGRDLNRDLVTAEFFRVGVQGDRAVANLFHSGIIGSTSLATGRWRGIEGHAWEFNSVYADPKRLGIFYVFTGTNLAVRRFPGIAGADNFVPFSPSDLAPPYTSGSGTSLAVGALAVDARPESGIVLYGAKPGPDADSDGFRLMKTDDGDRFPTPRAGGGFDDMPAWRSVINNGDVPIVSVRFEPYEPRRVYVISRTGTLFINDDVANDDGFVETDRWAVSNVRDMAVVTGPDPAVLAITSSRVGRWRPGAAFVDVGTTGLPSSELNSIAASPRDPHRLFLGADDGVYESTDQGDSWLPMDVDLPNAEILQIFVENNALWAVTHGRGLWRYSLC